MEESKEHAARLFTSLGFAAHEIPESNLGGEKRADLLVVINGERYLIEAKSKSAEKRYIEIAGETQFTLERVVEPWSSLSAITKQVARQLEGAPTPNITANIMFVSALHDDWKFVFDAWKQRLLGSTQLNLFRRTPQLPELVGDKTCHYYFEPDFARYRAIDAVLFAGPEGCQVVVNEFGRRRFNFRASALYSLAEREHCCVDSEVMRSRNEAIAVLDPAFRHDDAKRRQYILNAYGFMFSESIEHAFTAGLRLDRE